jgi:hypothetical protein
VLISSDDGERVVLWRDGVATTLPPPDGNRLHRGLDISPEGNVLGHVESDSGPDRYGLWRGPDFYTVSASPVESCWRVSDSGHIVCDSPARDYPFFTFVGTTRLGSRAVTDLSTSGASATTITVTWTQVPDDRGNPARYRVKYAPAPIDWRTAAVGCDRRGTAVGSPLSCTIRGLETATSYDFQLISYRLRSDGSWAGAVYSNIGIGETTSSGGSGDLQVDDLRVIEAGDNFLTMRWTQVDDGTGDPASYRLKWSRPPIDYATANVAVRCGRWIVGTQIGDDMTCVVDGLDPATAYELQLVSFKMVNGVWTNARYSNVASGSTTN